MHTAVVIILVFITEVITAFAGMVNTAQQTLPSVSGAPSMSSLTSFNLGGLQMMHTMVVPLVLVFTAANALVPSVADGGSRYKILSNFAITGAISGFALIILPMLASSLFASVAQM
jgi:archaellum biogenesis protein FlaJ (TadC family)